MDPASGDHLNPPAKRAKFASDLNNDIDYELVLELSIERMSDVRSLLELSRVNKRIRTAVFSNNGLRCITYLHGRKPVPPECNCSTTKCTILNGLHLKLDEQQSQEQKLMQGTSWVWKVARKLNSVRLVNMRNNLRIEKLVFELFGLSLSDNRKIKRIDLTAARIPESCLLPLVQEHRHTLEHLSVWRLERNFKAQAFWKMVDHCHQLHTLVILTTDVGALSEGLNLLRKTPLKTLGIWYSTTDISRHQAALTDALCCENFCRNLQDLIVYKEFGPLLSSMLATNKVFENVKELRVNFVDFIQCNPFNWNDFVRMFPVLTKLSFLWQSTYCLRSERFHALPEDMKQFCEKFLFSVCDRSSLTEIEIETVRVIGTEWTRERAETVLKAAGNADIKADEINVKSINGVIQKIVLQKGNAKLVFTLK